MLSWRFRPGQRVQDNRTCPSPIHWRVCPLSPYGSSKPIRTDASCVLRQRAGLWWAHRGFGDCTLRRVSAIGHDIGGRQFHRCLMHRLVWKRITVNSRQPRVPPQQPTLHLEACHWQQVLRHHMLIQPKLVRQMFDMTRSFCDTIQPYAPMRRPAQRATSGRLPDYALHCHMHQHSRPQ